MSRPGDDAHPSFADRALEQMRKWPALRVDDTGSGVTVRVDGSDAPIAWLYRPDAAELCLTWPVIQRLGSALVADGRVMAGQGSDWVRVRLHGTSDVRLVMMLISLAIREHASDRGAAGEDGTRSALLDPAAAGPPPPGDVRAFLGDAG